MSFIPCVPSAGAVLTVPAVRIERWSGASDELLIAHHAAQRVHSISSRERVLSQLIGQGGHAGDYREAHTDSLSNGGQTGIERTVRTVDVLRLPRRLALD